MLHCRGKSNTVSFLFKEILKVSNYFTKIIQIFFRLKRKHPYYYQIQGQLNITKREFCDLVIYNGKEIAVEKIIRDDDLWKDVMLPKLQAFYLNCILPEIIDARIPRDMTIRKCDLFSKIV